MGVYSCSCVASARICAQEEGGMMLTTTCSKQVTCVRLTHPRLVALQPHDVQNDIPYIFSHKYTAGMFLCHLTK